VKAFSSNKSVETNRRPASPERYLKLTALFVVLVIFLLMPLLAGVWLPDVFFARKHTLASHTLTNGYSFRVVQYWNRVDFYTTELHVTTPDGSTEVHVLDGDDSKSWRLPLLVDQYRRTATVTLGGGRVRTVEWR
jgi:hypothetical protein